MQKSSSVKVKNIRVNSLKPLFRLFQYAKPYWPEFTIGLLFLMVSSLSGLALPKLLGELIDGGKNGGNVSRIGWTLLTILIVQAVFSFFRVVMFVNVTEKTLSGLRQTIYNHLIKMPMSVFLYRRVGELSSRISADITLLQEVFNTTLAELIRQLITVVGGLVLLMMTSLQLTVFMLLLLPVMMVMASVLGQFINKYSAQVQDKVAASNTIVEETLQGIFSVKAFVGEFFEIGRYREQTNEMARLGMKGGKYRGIFNSFVILGIFGTLVAVIWRGATTGVGTGELFSFLLYSVFIANSITGLAEVYTSLQKCIGATNHLFELLEEPVEPLTEISAVAPENLLEGKINFRDIHFHYPSRTDINVLQGVSFQVEPNQKIAIVGSSGAGKSTIVSLLLRLYDPVKGGVFFDGRNGSTIPLSELRLQIAVVPQDVFLFGGTIGENIGYGRKGATVNEIIAAAEKANAWEFIQRFPLGLDTIVGERGIQLSGGQRQRIAIARAVLKAPRILILDEATSALDAESERLVQDALDKLMEGRTSIVIAHRLATVRQADKIIVLDKGCIVEEGTHYELIGVNGGLYKNLSEMQFTN
ncbi:ABC transporter ATP-binding protein [Pedobacter cryoconitis]|uniref:ABC-type multidrug transport system fused ATPase/permease subunit n=1 Tax=Pedobacter cryoconitis TaxID=188932 RepID=A0A7X0IZG8_9SPHI|nr:ABC transporter transmembrane domain-containing protein [Pedobacter cryoconitis]MBB6498038.1 ABC-type multidrug transport system fused ATPase/permease subunit [Pedobacter cryoconitis]